MEETGSRQRAAANPCEVEFQTRHEEGTPHPKREHLRNEALELDKPQDMGADEDAKDDFEHDDRHAKAERNLREQRRRNGGDQ